MRTLSTPAPALCRAIRAANAAGRKMIIDIGCGPTPSRCIRMATADPSQLYIGIDPCLRLPLYVVQPNLLMHKGNAMPALVSLAEHSVIDEIHIIAPQYSPQLLSMFRGRKRRDSTTMIDEEIAVYHSMLRGQFLVATEDPQNARNLYKVLQQHFARVETVMFVSAAAIRSLENNGLLPIDRAKGYLEQEKLELLSPAQYVVAGALGGLRGVLESPHNDVVWTLFPREQAPETNHMTHQDPVFQLVGIV